MQNNDITMLKITRKNGEAVFIGDICVRIIGFNPEAFHLLIDDKCELANAGVSLKITDNIKIILTKNTSHQIKCKIFAPKSVIIAREEIAQFDESGRLMRPTK